MTPEKAKNLAVKIISRKILAKKLGITTQAISQWRIVPARHVFAVEAMTEGVITASELRPDMFDHENKQTKAA